MAGIQLKVRIFNEAFRSAWERLPPELKRNIGTSERLRDYVQTAVRAGLADPHAIAAAADVHLRRHSQHLYR